MGLFFLGPLIGPVLGPLLGGYINQCKCSSIQSMSNISHVLNDLLNLRFWMENDILDLDGYGRACAHIYHPVFARNISKAHYGTSKKANQSSRRYSWYLEL